MSHSGLNHFS